MSDINLDFTVSNNSINFTVEPNEITITPTDIQLTIAGAVTLAGGTTTQIQYNNAGSLAGVPNVTWNGSKLSLGNVSSVTLGGGINGYVLQTDGTGNLTWTAQTGGGGGGNGVPGGSNTQIQYNDSGNFNGNAGFTFNELNGNVDIPGNLNVVGNIIGNIPNSDLANYANYAGNVINSSQPNITSVGSLVDLTVVGNINSGNIYTAGLSGNIFGVNVITANTFIGNIAGPVILANYATVANSVAGANVSGTVANATYATNAGIATSATTAGTVTTAAQPNITSLGNLTSLTLNTSNIQLGPSANATFGNSVAIGNLARSKYDAVAIGSYSNSANYSVAIGHTAGQTGLIDGGVSIGHSAGRGSNTFATTVGTVAIGEFAGNINQSNRAIAIGIRAGDVAQGINSIAIGAQAGKNNQHGNSIVINSTGTEVNTTQGDSTFIKPIRDVTGNAAFTVQLYYNPTTGEIGYK